MMRCLVLIIMPLYALCRRCPLPQGCNTSPDLPGTDAMMCFSGDFHTSQQCINGGPSTCVVMTRGARFEEDCLDLFRRVDQRAPGRYIVMKWFAYCDVLDTLMPLSQCSDRRVVRNGFIDSEVFRINAKLLYSSEHLGADNRPDVIETGESLVYFCPVSNHDTANYCVTPWSVSLYANETEALKQVMGLMAVPGDYVAVPTQGKFSILGSGSICNGYFTIHMGKGAMGNASCENENATPLEARAIYLVRFYR